MDSKIHGDIDEVLYFFKDFKLPSTNNNAESSQRGVKAKQKIGKFRSLEGTDSYLNIKSCILNYKKQGIDILEAIISLLLMTQLFHKKSEYKLTYFSVS